MSPNGPNQTVTWYQRTGLEFESPLVIYSSWAVEYSIIKLKAGDAVMGRNRKVQKN